MQNLNKLLSNCYNLVLRFFILVLLFIDQRELIQSGSAKHYSTVYNTKLVKDYTTDTCFRFKFCGAKFV
jgi:hypothetical protein